MGVASSRGRSHEYLEADEFEAWNALMALNRTVLAALDEELRARHRLSVREFDVLITLFNAPGRRLGMTALAEQVMFSQSGLTHLVTRLERDGLVRREVDLDDRRKWFTVLTDAGDRRLREARVAHNQVLHATLLAHTTAEERSILQRVWRRMADAS